jgi:lipid II:glycine glycyltransferase (peptidoglycan interpeptide bridge formation enzyme)
MKSAGAGSDSRGEASRRDSPALAEHLRAQGVRDLFVDPELDADPRYDAAMDRYGFRPAAEFQPSTHVMRLSLPPDSTETTVLAGFTRSIRQRIRAAEKAGITVREDSGGQLIDAFGELLVERARDLHIDMRRDTGYLTAWRHLVAAGHARLLVAEHGGQLLGGLLLYIQAGMLSTAYSADRAALRRQFPGTMHLVRWRAIRDALAMGAPAIELGGVDLPGHREPPGPDEPNHGLYEHKRSFGAKWVVRTPARRIVLRPWAERLAATRSGALRRARQLRHGR